MKTMSAPSLFTIAVLMFCMAASPAVRAASDDDVANEYRLTLFPYYPFSKELTGFGYLGFVPNWDKDYMNYYLGFGACYDVNEWLQPWAGLIASYTDNWNASDKLELRPFVGAKLFMPNEAKWNIYAFPRYEYRMIENLDTHEWSYINRVRLRVGAEIPLTTRENAWKPKTWYALADVEPIYRFDKDQIDPLRLRAGIGYVLGKGVRMEFIYHAQFTRPSGSDSLKFTDNIFRLNIKFPLGKGYLGQPPALPDADD